MDTKLSPKFLILKARPERYIKTPSSTIVALIRLLEAAVSLVLLFRVGAYFSGLLCGSSPSLFGLPGFLQADHQSQVLPPALETFVQEQLADIMPEGESLDSLLLQVTGDSTAGLQVLMSMGSAETIVTAIATAGLLAVLVGTVAEGVVLLPLRFAMKGSKTAKIAHKVIFFGALVMLLAGICLTLIFLNKCRMMGIMMSALLVGQLRSMGILIVACLVLLLLRVLYHRDVAKVLAAVDFEVSMEFKEMDVPVKRLPGLSLLFIFLFLAAAVLLAVVRGLFPAGTIIAAILTIKYLMVYSCWGNFKRSHM